MKQALNNGQSLVGTMLAEIRQPAVMQLLKNAGFDFVIIDNEHGPFGLETVADLSRMALSLDLTPVVRVPELFYPYLAQSLDAGGQGLMVPRITHAGQVREAVEMMKYPPLGRRGCALGRGHTAFKSGPLSETMARANEETLLIIQIETEEAIDNIEEIVATPGVDVALIGPTDLSIAMGVPGQMDSPKLHTAIKKMIDACQRHQTAPAIHINNLEWAVYWIEQGMRLVSSFSEAGLLTRGGLEVTSTMQKAFK
jgi:4-hydroxy-2-oxoheptanedioate aldolase